MMNQITNHEDFVKEIYKSFYKKKYQKLPTIRDNKLISNFLERVVESGRELNYRYLFKYLCFSWSVWDYLDEAQHNISLNWILSKKTWYSFLSKRVSHNYIISKNPDFYNSDHILSHVEENKDIDQNFNMDDYMKVNHSNILQVDFCNIQSLSYSDNSKVCQSCGYQVECKNKLKKQDFRSYLLNQ